MDALKAEHESAAGGGRMEALDVFRGITIAGMILVNNPGTWSAIHDPLEHAAWHGWTPTDLVFPFFLFIVGVSITLALGRRVESASAPRGVYVKIIRRASIIFALGLLLAAFPFDNVANVRIPGVLQRIAVCYFFASIIFLKTTWRTQSLVAAALLVLYYLLMTLVPVPSYGAGDLSMEGNLAAYIDRRVLTVHTWKPLYDPEGILSTIPALATALCGVLAGHLLRSQKSPIEKVSAMFVAGAVGVASGWVWNFWFPINKALWTSSYVLLSAGLALQFLALCYWLIDIHKYRRWAAPFLIFGSNALAVYFLSELSSRIISLVTLTRADGGAISLKAFIYENLFASWATPVNASLMFAVSTVLLWLGLMSLLYRRKIFIKV
jgi:predicted acyltransferase